jgi:hypothetical protein
METGFKLKFDTFLVFKANQQTQEKKGSEGNKNAGKKHHFDKRTRATDEEAMKKFKKRTRKY